MNGVHIGKMLPKVIENQSLSWWCLSSSVSWNPLLDDKCPQEFLLDMYYLGQDYRSCWTPIKFLESQHDDIWRCVSKIKGPLKFYFINILE